MQDDPLKHLNIARKEEELAPERPAQNQDEAIITNSWPVKPADEAFHGLAGDIVRAIEPHTEADPAALLSQFLVAFGNVIGLNPYFMAEADRHGMNLFITLVGETAKGRKGTSRGHVQRLFKSVASEWAKECTAYGLSSGEGLIWAVRDAIEKLEPIRDKGAITGYQTVIIDPGIEDKRLLVFESELASVLKVMGREGNTLSAIIRQAWDSGELKTLTKNSPAKASGAHISLIGHITKDELLRHLDNTETANGFANRFLWFCVKRSKTLPEGGRINEVDFAPILRRLSEAVEFARTVGEIKRDDEARALWCEVYPDLSEGKPGLLGAVTARAEAQVMRLSCIYALLDCSPAVGKEHLLAALALWEYAEASARYIFGGSLGDPVADRVLRALRTIPGGLTRTEIRDLFGRNMNGRRIDRALTSLLERALARSEREKQDTGGRPVEHWFAVEATT